MAAVISWATAASETRAASPLPTRSRAARSRSAAKSSIQAHGSLRHSRSGSEDDIDLAPDDLQFRLPQAHARVALMPAGLDAVFIPVPRADDVFFGRTEAEHPHAAVGCDRFLDARENPSLAHRTAPMGAVIVPGIELAVDLEDADLGV